MSTHAVGRSEGTLTRFRTQKTGVLLAYLAYYPQRTHRRDELIELLWPDAELSAASNSLSQALSSLRRQLEPPGVLAGAVLMANRASVRLNPEAVTTDIAAFEAARHAAASAASDAERRRWLTEAVELYRGELLAGYYEPWVLEQREWVAESYFQALRQLLLHLEEARDWDRALAYARQGVRMDPLREETHRGLMRLLAAAGQPSAALRQYRELERILEHELGSEPEAATCALFQEIEALAGTPASLVSLTEPRGRAVERVGPPPAPAERGSEAADAVPLDSAFYVVRPTDSEFRAALAQQESIVSIKGARQMGKTSLLARGLQGAREAGARVVLTDFQKLDTGHLASAHALLLSLAQWIADQLDLDVFPEEVWNTHRDPILNFERYLRREVLGKVTAPLVWGLDEVDRLFTGDLGGPIFGLFRSWHNARALDPTGPWSRLTLAIAYATEAHLFITDLNQSPFNVGTRLQLEDFTREQVADLNRRYGSPLRDEPELGRLYRLIGGHPDLVRRSLHAMATRGMGIASLEAEADRDEGLFGDHLRYILVRLSRDPDLCDVVRGVLRGRPCPSVESFYRLRSAGLIVGEAAEAVRPRCHLYARYLERHLR